MEILNRWKVRVKASPVYNSDVRQGETKTFGPNRTHIACSPRVHAAVVIVDQYSP